MQPSRIAPLVLCVLVVAAFANGINGALVFDDIIHIANNAKIREPASMWAPLLDTTRPWVLGSLAINYAISGLATWSYHVVNILLHLCSALCLYGILRHVFHRQPALKAHSIGLAFTAAGLWAVHPLQTQSVTYLIQRAEAGMGLCILLMLYALIRADQSTRPRPWLILSAGSCFFGYGFKPIMVISMFLGITFDICYLSGSFRAALQRRRGYYLALAASPLLLIALLASSTWEWKSSAGFSNDSIRWLDYAATQPEIILHYLKLTIWPQPLCLDYGWEIETRRWVIFVTSTAILGLFALTIQGLRRCPAWGFLGAWFFINLAPTSSFVPIVDLAFEHRMYLALAAPLITLTLLGFFSFQKSRSPASHWLPKLTAASALLLAASFTVSRNADYQNAARLLASNAEARPNYARPRLNLALELVRVKQPARARLAFEQAIAIKPDYFMAQRWYGQLLLENGELDLARQHLQKAAELKPEDWETRMALGSVLGNLHQDEQAIAQFEETVRLAPQAAGAHLNLGTLFQRRGDRPKAILHFKEAIRLAPTWAAPAQALERIENLP